jgi:predicted PurR-regulated permease PerM
VILRRHGWPPALAASVVTLQFLLVAAGTVVLDAIFIGLGLWIVGVPLVLPLGGSLAGIAGSLLAVPVAALCGVVWSYLREQLSDPPQEPETSEPGSGTVIPAGEPA